MANPKSYSLALFKLKFDAQYISVIDIATGDVVEQRDMTTDSRLLKISGTDFKLEDGKLKANSELCNTIHMDRANALIKLDNASSIVTGQDPEDGAPITTFYCYKIETCQIQFDSNGTSVFITCECNNTPGACCNPCYSTYKI